MKATAQELQAVSPVTAVGERLRRDRPDLGLRCADERADGEKLRLDADSPLAALEVARDERVRRDRYGASPSAGQIRRHGLPVRQAAKVELAQLSALGWNEGAGNFGSSERLEHAFGVASADDDGQSTPVGVLEASDVTGVAEDERRDLAPAEADATVADDVEVLAFDRDLGHAKPGRAEPPEPQRSIVSPGEGAKTSHDEACRRSSSGVPARRGNVP